MIVYENFLPQDYFYYLNDLVIREEEPKINWYFNSSISGIDDNNNSNNQYGFSHTLFLDNPNSIFFEHFSPIISIMSNQYNIQIITIKRMRLGMQTKVGNESIINYPHIDYFNEHEVFLLYLNDANGDTVFYDNDKKEINRVSPRPNRAVLFDGLIPHSSSTPTNNSRRIALNINFNLI